MAFFSVTFQLILRADLHGTIFVACDNGLRQAHDMIYDCCVRQKKCRSILKHVLKRCDNRKSCRRPVVRLSHATKIVPCKSALSQLVPAYKDALLHRNYKHCFSNEHFTVPKYNIWHSSSSVKSINLTNIPTPRQLLQKNYHIYSLSDFQIINHFALQKGSRKDTTVSQKTRMTCTLAIFGEKSQTFACNPK